ncbi:DUF4199 domain-containing protein [Rufibacter tibetensis]|uniref:DUF4199 domain-containing protein n=1 Tax=Rufibacter tibetensis TaxID=512763 RepID=A0A0P0CT33_9BACT|nr:DUF4199 domain-containing protein [Rufibacter tibetensis]ALJ00668.1 hypothetical protein DC20_18910 [Rufibacter tibetensis]
MEQRQVTVQKTGTSFGVMTGIAAILYMVLIKLVGLIENVSLHFLVGVILVVGVCLAIRRHKSTKTGKLGYLEGIGVGFFVGLVSSVLFTLFQVITNKMFDMAFLYPYMVDDTSGDEQALWVLAVIWLMMGVVIGAFVGYIAMQFFKRPDHKLTS